MTAIPARVTLITLGVADLSRAIAFYERLGWRRSLSAGSEGVAFFALDHVVLGLFPRTELAADAHVENTPAGFSGVTLAINMGSKAEVDGVLAAARAAGASVPKPAEKVFWGGYSGYFADPDGHLWEVAHNPFFPMDAEGRVVLPD